MKEISGQLNAKGNKPCIVISRFNDFLTRQLLGGAVDCHVRHGGKEDDITVIWVPGANELPMAVTLAAEGGKYNSVIALGAVIKGATQHSDLIITQVSRALGAVAMESGLPVINGVVCADSLEQGIERCGTKAGNKGWSAMLAAIEMTDVCKQLR